MVVHIQPGQISVLQQSSGLIKAPDPIGNDLPATTNIEPVDAGPDVL